MTAAHEAALTIALVAIGAGGVGIIVGYFVGRFDEARQAHKLKQAHKERAVNYRELD